MIAAGTYADSPKSSFALAQYRWDYRLLVVSAPTENDKRLRQQQKAVQQAIDDFADRDMILVTLLDDAVSTAGNRELTAEDTATARAALGISSESFALRLIGKDGTVKLSSEEPTSMNEIFALIDTMPMRQREMAGRKY